MQKKRARRFELDTIDKKILDLLQHNNQITNLELAEKINLSPPPCLRRVKRLRENGIIMRDVSLVNPFKIKQHLVTFIGVSLEKQCGDFLSNFEKEICEYPEVKQCYFISGEVDYLLLVHTTDTDAYNEFIRRAFVNDPNIKSFRSSFCLEQIKYDTSINLADDL